MLSKHSNGEIQRTIQNCITILQNDHVLADAIRLNLLSERIDIVKPVGWPRSGKTLNDIDMKYILRRMEKYGIPIEKKIEMSEMIATANAKSIEEIKSFLSKQKETYKVPYETHPADRLRQCVFAGTTNRQDFLPRDRTGNRRFIPIPVDAELAEVHILDNEEESRAYIDQLWAEAMTIYNSGNYKLAFSPAMQETLQAHQ
ncbi:MAG: VapE family protein, partial [Faecalibacterium sp.]|nr:VapE family protein [Faecalibacterium sp.]